MNLKKLRKYLEQEEAQVFKGWNFGYLKGRWETGTYHWDYRTIVEQFRKDTDQLLDMGTGDGHFLLTLNHPYRQTAVTEGWEPNLRLCREKLEPLGITVKSVGEDNVLAYPDNYFDLVINRHESFDAKEVYRILKPNGYFVTQQVGGMNNQELIRKIMGDVPVPMPKHNLEYNVQLMETQGFSILVQMEAQSESKFFDLGSVVYLAKQLPWEFPHFSVELYFEKLAALEQELTNQGYISSYEHRFVIAARK